MLHHFPAHIEPGSLPERFTYPFCYDPHPLCIKAAQEVQAYLARQVQWEEELKRGKMFGVLVVQTKQGEIGYLAAFSGILAGKNRHSFFVPPIYDLLQPQGFFKMEEECISNLNARIAQLEADEEYRLLTTRLAHLEQHAQEVLKQAKLQLKAAREQREERRKAAELTAQEEAALIGESQFAKAEYKRMEQRLKEEIALPAKQVAEYEWTIQQCKKERKMRSAALQQRLFEQFDLLNARKETKNLCDIFALTVQKTPPAGAGECAAPKLLQQAYLHNWQPIAMAEFWWGASPKTEIRRHGQYYPACKGKCEPILQHMLQGLEVDDNPLWALQSSAAPMPEVVYEDQWLLVVNKPAGMLSVPGKEEAPSVYSWMRRHRPCAEGPIMVHRLDMATSGLLIMAKTKEMHRRMQALFEKRLVMKRYIALLNGNIIQDEGVISLPLAPDWLDRPRQVVDEVQGKPTETRFEVIAREGAITRVAFYPRTGRTHQLRVHAAHPLGLNCPIVGDELYGKKHDRLYLHAQCVEFIHPFTGECVRITQEGF